MSTDGERAKSAAWQAAVAIAHRHRVIAEAVFKSAELDVIRRLLCATLDGGEAAYWDLVAKEIES